MVYAKALATAQEDREDAEKVFIEKAKEVFKRLEREIEARDKEIDRMVYELYGLSEEEIRVVEGSK